MSFIHGVFTLFLTGAVALSVIGVTPSVSGREQVRFRPMLTRSILPACLKARHQPRATDPIDNRQN